MRKRFLSIAFVVVALLFSAWGNVIAAAFCPRSSLNRDCCLKLAAQQAKQVKPASCHHEMAGMEMDDMQMETEADSAPDINAQNSQVEFAPGSSSEEALDLPIEPCAHCLSHSQATSGTVSLVATDPSKRLVETNSPPANVSIALAPLFSDLIVPSEHSPPGSSAPRHLMINVFRI